MASVYTYISRVKSPQNVCLGLLKDSSQAQAGTRPLRHKADKARDRRAEAVFVGCSLLICGCFKCRSMCKERKRRLHIV